MESSGFSQKKWKYLSFALMGILAAGVLTQPQAFALTDSQLKKKFDEIWAAINGLKATDSNLQNQINTIELTPGPAGQDGTDGVNGLNCWDLDGDGVQDASEDINSDGQWNALDCKGPKGDNGADGLNGVNGSAGLNCWDLNGDGVKDAGEDVNDDGFWDALDCQGSSTGFRPNAAPIVDAGPDQSVEGASFQSGGVCFLNICTPITYNLGCEFDLAGDVQDDEFTGFLSTKWSSSPGVEFSSEDSPNTHVGLGVSSSSPITNNVGGIVTLTADDGILEASDDALLTCEVPAG